MSTAVTAMFVGDMILDDRDPDRFFAPCAQLLGSADLVVGHVEVPHTDRGVESTTDIPAAPAPPAHLEALPRAGFAAVSVAGNHTYDAGVPGVVDTRATLERIGIAAAGSGMNLDEARAPALVQRGGLRFGLLSYNCAGPRESWATSGKAGCAYIHVLTHYELDHPSPGGPPQIYTFATPATVEAMAADIRALRSQVDVVVVALHKGVLHTPATVAMYETQVTHAAVDAGADIVIGHHAHILRGVELYRGKPIFHGLGNFITVTASFALEGNVSPERQAWGQRRKQIYGFELDPAMPTYPFHPESRNTMVAVVRIAADGSFEPGLVPCYIDDDARPVPRRRGDGGEQVVAYIADITRRAGLNAEYVWRDDTFVSISEAPPTPAG